MCEVTCTLLWGLESLGALLSCDDCGYPPPFSVSQGLWLSFSPLMAESAPALRTFMKPLPLPPTLPRPLSEHLLPKSLCGLCPPDMKNAEGLEPPCALGRGPSLCPRAVSIRKKTTCPAVRLTHDPSRSALRVRTLDQTVPAVVGVGADASGLPPSSVSDKPSDDCSTSVCLPPGAA